MLNNSESESQRTFPTYVANGAFRRIYGSGPAELTTNSNRRLSVTVPALWTVVYQSSRADPQANHAPEITLNSPQISPESNSRMRVSANVSGSAFNEVSFYAKTGKGGWKYIGTTTRGRTESSTMSVRSRTATRWSTARSSATTPTISGRAR